MISIKPFEEQHLEEAAGLFAANYRRLRRENELLPADFQDTEAVRAMLERIIQEHPGRVAIDGKRVVGYLTGFSEIPALKGLSSGAYVPVWAHGIEAPQDVRVVYPALYAEMSAEWVEQQCFSQVVSYFLPDHGLEGLLYGLGFGLFVIDGIRALSPLAVAKADDVEIRAAKESDLADLLVLNRKLARHLSGAPIFLKVDAGQETLEEARRRFLSQGMKAFVAAKDGGLISCIRGVLNKGPGCELLDVEGSLGINFAYTNTAVREQGIATRVLDELMKWGVVQGMERCVVDFEAANLAAKGFWLRHFQPICHSVIRRIDERI